MVKPKLTILDVTALVLTILAAIVHIIGCFIPNWYTYESFNGEHVVIGMLKSTGCDRFKRCDRNIANIDGGKEWLFMTRIFELFGVILCLVATTVQICFLPTRNINIRSVAIYALGAAGLFIIAGDLIFASMHKDLTTNNVDDKNGPRSIGPGLGLCILSGILSIVAAVVTVVTTVKRTSHHMYTDS